MRNYPEDKWDFEELEGLRAEPWMVEALKRNPGYTCWGPGEDAWYDVDKQGGRSGLSTAETWADFEKNWTPDDYNEFVHFYFKIDREAHVRWCVWQQRYRAAELAGCDDNECRRRADNNEDTL